MSNYLDQLVSLDVVVLQFRKYFALRLFPYFERKQVPLQLYGLCNEFSGVLFDEHELQHVELLERDSLLVELFQIVLDFALDLGQALVVLVFIALVVYVSQNVLDLAKELEQLTSRLKDFSAEDVLFPIDSEVGEAFLSRVKDFREVAEVSFFVENSVCAGEVIPVSSCLCGDFEALCQLLELY